MRGLAYMKTLAYTRTENPAIPNSGPPPGVAGRVRADLDRAEIGGRARRLAEFAVKVTLALGRTRVVIPNRQRVCDLLKIGKNHVAEVICALETARIVRIKDVADGWELLFFADPQQWLVDWIYQRDEMAAFITELNRAAGQAQTDFGESEVSFEPDPDIDRERAAVAVNEPRTTSPRPSVAAPLAIAPAARSHFGNRERPMVPGVSQNGNHSARPAGLKEFKTPTSKAYSFESLRDALLEIETGNEQQALAGMVFILGADVMEPSARNPVGDGGKWRNRWRANRSKVHRVMATVVERSRQVKIRQLGAEAEERWKEAGSTRGPL